MSGARQAISDLQDEVEATTAELLDTHIRLTSAMVNGLSIPPTTKGAILVELDRIRELASSREAS